MPSHAEQISPDSTGIEQLTDDYNNSLNVNDSQSSGLVGKFRSSLKKKISIKGMAGLAKTPTRTGTRRTEDEDGDKERTGEEEERAEKSEGLEVSENVDVDVVEKAEDEVQEVEETVETTTHVVEESVEVKKKKKKKRKPREEEVEQQEIEVVESTPVKAGAVSGGVKLPDFAESPVVTVETEEISYEVTTEEQSGGKVKKTKRRTHKKRTQETEDDHEA